MKELLLLRNTKTLNKIVVFCVSCHWRMSHRFNRGVFSLTKIHSSSLTLSTWPLVECRQPRIERCYFVEGIIMPHRTHATIRKVTCINRPISKATYSERRHSHLSMRCAKLHASVAHSFHECGTRAVRARGRSPYTQWYRPRQPA